MIRVVAALIVVCFSALSALAQSSHDASVPTPTTVCELQKNSAAFNGQLVAVKAGFVRDRYFGWLVEGACASVYMTRPRDFPNSSPYSKLKLVRDSDYENFMKQTKAQCEDGDLFDCQELRGEFVGVYFVPERTLPAQAVNGGLVLLSVRNTVLIPKGIIPIEH